MVAFRGRGAARSTEIFPPISAPSTVTVTVTDVVCALGLEFPQQRTQGLRGDFQTEEFREFGSHRTAVAAAVHPVDGRKAQPHVMLDERSQFAPRLASGQSPGEGFGIAAFEGLGPFLGRARIDPESGVQIAEADSHVGEVTHHQLEADILLIGRNHIEQLDPVINVILPGLRVLRDGEHRPLLVGTEDGLQMWEGLHTPRVWGFEPIPSIRFAPTLPTPKIPSNSICAAPDSFRGQK